MILRLILGDQLNIQHPWFSESSDSILYCMAEIRPESEYVTHHYQKISAFFYAMRHFAQELKQKGHALEYFSINQAENPHDFIQILRLLCQKYPISAIEIQEPDEYRLDKLFKTAELPVPLHCVSSHHFYTERNSFLEVYPKKPKTFLMESFYRFMRKRHKVLIDSESNPLGGKWNFDADNRKTWKGSPYPQAFPQFNYDFSIIAQDIAATQLPHFGNMHMQLDIPLTRKDALEVLDFFIAEYLPFFGDYQDAMTSQHAYLFHSRISFALNVKLINPQEVISRVEAEYLKNPTGLPLSSVEGFIRQILGWREFVRGFYWYHMPAYTSENALHNSRTLPNWYWNGNTRMKCLKSAIDMSLNTAYAHHIQRLMVTGNFALLAGINPAEVDAWYLGGKLTGEVAAFI